MVVRQAGEREEKLRVAMEDADDKHCELAPNTTLDSL